MPTARPAPAPIDDPLRPPTPKGSGLGWIAALLALAAVAYAWWWWVEREPAPEPPVASAPQPVPPTAPAEPAIRYPLELPVGTAPVDAPGLSAALAELLGPAGMALLQLNDFPRRFVATVDNLGRDHAPPLIWPVQPAPGRFTVQQLPDGPQLHGENAKRYAPYLAVLEQVDPAGAAALYRRMFPLLQQAWHDLGMGDRYFNDRLVEVIDLLLATPEPAEPPRLRLTEVKGPIAPERPWVRYEFADPRLQSLAAGQKILVRMGLANERRLKAWLTAFRAELLRSAR